MQERYKKEFPLTQEVVQSLVNNLYKKHAAFPNWKEGDPDLPRLRFFIGDSVFCINGSNKFINRLIQRLPEGGLSAEYFADHFCADKRDIQSEEGYLTSLNRGWLDFRFHESPKDKELVSFAEVAKNPNFQLAIGIPTYK